MVKETTSVDAVFKAQVKTENAERQKLQWAIRDGHDRQRIGAMQQDQRPLLVRAREAISWGCPDNESTGMSHSKLTSIIAELVAELERRG